MNDRRVSRPRAYPAHIQVSERSRSPLRQESVGRNVDRRLPPVAAATISPHAGADSRRGATPVHDTATLPMQFFTEPGGTSEFATGAQRLMFAVLQDAVACWFRWRNGGTARKRRLFQEAYDWFWAANPRGLYAFENICEVLRLDPDYLRCGLMRWHPSAVEPQTHAARAPALNCEGRGHEEVSNIRRKRKSYGYSHYSRAI